MLAFMPTPERQHHNPPQPNKALAPKAEKKFTDELNKYKIYTIAC